MKKKLGSDNAHIELTNDAYIRLADCLSQLNEAHIDNEFLSIKEDELIIKLERQLKEAKRRMRIISEPKHATSLYDYIIVFLKEYPEKRKEISFALPNDTKALYGIEKKIIKIIDINPASLAMICKKIALSLQDAVNLTQKTIQLDNIGNSTANSMARYSYKNGLEEKGESMQKGLNELLLKANANKPLTTSTKTNSSIVSRYIEEFKEKYHDQ
jgi:hypothetical protein